MTTTEQILEEIKTMQAKLDALMSARLEPPAPATNDYQQRKAEFLNKLHAPKRAKS